MKPKKSFSLGISTFFTRWPVRFARRYVFARDALTASHPLATWFTRSITAPAGSAPAPPSMLAQLGWQPDDCYVIASIYLSDCESPLSACIAAFTDSNHCCAVPPESLCMLIRLSHNDLTDEIEYLRRHGLADSHRIGLSLPFQGLDRLPAVLSAVALGRAICPAKKLVSGFHTGTASRGHPSCLPRYPARPSNGSPIHPEIGRRRSSRWRSSA